MQAINSFESIVLSYKTAYLAVIVEVAQVTSSASQAALSLASS
jgi:hypothetical protein